VNSALLVLAGGLLLLLLGAEFLVRGSSSLARRLGMSPLLIGLTIVALGTSAPEIGISVMAALNGQGDLAVGNVVGSNIFNVLVILGISALVTPLIVSRQLIRFEIPVVIVASLLVLWMGQDGALGPIEGVILLSGLCVYLLVTIRSARKAPAGEPISTPPASGNPIMDVSLVIVGVLTLMFGSKYLVDGASELARSFGLSELIIGLTIVAGGTSVPEVATSVLAVIRGERDLAVGNAIGSCLFNLLAVLGIASIVSPEPIGIPAAALAVDLPIMVATAIICLPLAFTHGRIDRWEGALLTGYYVAYTTWIVLNAQGHDAATSLSTVVLRYILPLTALALIVSLYRSRKAQHSPES
jgi:cation:H+ antiporter